MVKHIDRLKTPPNTKQYDAGYKQIDWSKKDKPTKAQLELDLKGKKNGNNN
jgi:hypothetical protein